MRFVLYIRSSVYEKGILQIRRSIISSIHLMHQHHISKERRLFFCNKIKGKSYKLAHIFTDAFDI